MVQAETISETDLIQNLCTRSQMIGRRPDLCLPTAGSASQKSGREKIYIQARAVNLKHSQPADVMMLHLPALLTEIEKKKSDQSDALSFFGKGSSAEDKREPSADALMHAVLPYTSVNYSPADAVLAIANTSNPREFCKRAFGEEAFFIPRKKTNLDWALAVQSSIQSFPKARGAILENKGLLSWANDCGESVKNHFLLVDLALTFIANHGLNQLPFGASSHIQISDEVRAELASKAIKCIQSGLPKTQTGFFSHDASPTVLAWLTSRKGEMLAQMRPATSDYEQLINRIPYFVDWRMGEAGLEQSIHLARQTAFALPIFPSLYLIPDIGLISQAETLAQAQSAAEVFRHHVSIMLMACRIDNYQPTH